MIVFYYCANKLLFIDFCKFAIVIKFLNITLKLIERKDLPKDVVEIIGDTNNIVNNLIVNLVSNSLEKKLSFSKEYAEALNCLRNWSNEKIYNNPKKKLSRRKNKKYI